MSFLVAPGFLRKKGDAGPVHPQTAAALLAAGVGNGLATSIYDGNDFTTDLVGSNNLTATNSPTEDVDASEFGAGELCVQIGNATTQSFVAASNSVFDVTTGSFAILVRAMLTTAPSSYRGLVGKRLGSSAYNGYEAYIGAAGPVVCRSDQGASDQLSTVVSAYRLSPSYWADMLYVRDVTNSKHGVYTDNGADDEDALTITGSLTNTATFAVGNQPIRSSAPVKIKYMAIWLGSAAEGMNAADITAMNAAVALPTP